MIRLKSLLTETIDDSQYLELIKNKDEIAVRKMVETAAKRNGYNIGPVYHGTPNDFFKFDLEKLSHGRYGDGIYFHGNYELARSFNLKNNGRVISAYIKLHKPIIPKMENGYLDWGKQRATPEYGDGVIVPNSRKGDEIYIVFNPNQIKSADLFTKDDVGNIIPLSQRFDSSIEDIRY